LREARQHPLARLGRHLISDGRVEHERYLSARHCCERGSKRFARVAGHDLQRQLSAHGESSVEPMLRRPGVKRPHPGDAVFVERHGIELEPDAFADERRVLRNRESARRAGPPARREVVDVGSQAARRAGLATASRAAVLVHVAVHTEIQSEARAHFEQRQAGAYSACREYEPRVQSDATQRIVHLNGPREQRPQLVGVVQQRRAQCDERAPRAVCRSTEAVLGREVADRREQDATRLVLGDGVGSSAGHDPHEGRVVSYALPQRLARFTERPKAQQ
jgi:hypothetical protein